MKALAVLLALAATTGCAELGLINDGTSVSIGKPSGGFLVEGKRLPDAGDGFTTREIWRSRENRYGTDELIDLLVGVGRTLARTPGERLVVADLSCRGGGGAGARKWHRSHQTGRDVDLVYFMRDAAGARMQADYMRVFDATGTAKDKSGITIDIPRTWELVRALLTADEATVQWVFMYQPIANKIIDHAIALGESEEIIERARMVMKQPGDSARHDDHIHVRVYCSDRDLRFGCVDIGPMGPREERIAARQREGQLTSLVAQLISGAVRTVTTEALATTIADVAPLQVDTVGLSSPQNLRSLGRFFLRWH